MLIKTTFVSILFLTAFHGNAQIQLMFGVNGGRYKFLESPQANTAAKFNLGYEYSYDPTSNTPDFSGSTDTYELTKEMNWNQTNTGIVFGFNGYLNEKVSQSLYFEGKSNSAQGKRTNTTQNYEETFSMKSKFGGIHYNITFYPFQRIGFFYDLGFTRYRVKFSAASPNSEEFKHQTMGYELHLLSSKYTLGSKGINVVNGFGLDLALMKSEKLEISLRPEIGFAVNEMSEVSFGVYYSSWIFNLNYVQVGFIIKPTIIP